MNPVTSIIKALLNITVTVPDKDRDGFIKIPINFSIDTSTIQPLFYLGGTSAVGTTSAAASTPTSASFAATLGLLLQLLIQLISELVAQVEAIQNVH